MQNMERYVHPYKQQGTCNRPPPLSDRHPPPIPIYPQRGPVLDVIHCRRPVLVELFPLHGRKRPIPELRLEWSCWVHIRRIAVVAKVAVASKRDRRAGDPSCIRRGVEYGIGEVAPDLRVVRRALRQPVPAGDSCEKDRCDQV